jgi:hypothetical protein
LWYSDWSILPGQSLPHEELYRSVIIFVIQELKSSGMWCTRRSESPVYPSVLYVDMYWPARLSLAYWPGRQSLEYCRSILDNFFINLRCTFLHTYNVHCDAYSLKFILFLFFWTLEGGAWVIWILIKPTTGGFLILKLLLCTGGVTAKERTGLRHSF